MPSSQAITRPSRHSSYRYSDRSRQSSICDGLSRSLLEFRKKYEATKRKAHPHSSRIAILIELFTKEVKKQLSGQNGHYDEKSRQRDHRHSSRRRPMRTLRNAYEEQDKGRDDDDGRRGERDRDNRPMSLRRSAGYEPDNTNAFGRGTLRPKRTARTSDLGGLRERFKEQDRESTFMNGQQRVSRPSSPRRTPMQAKDNTDNDSEPDVRLADNWAGKVNIDGNSRYSRDIHCTSAHYSGHAAGAREAHIYHQYQPPVGENYSSAPRYTVSSKRQTFNQSANLAQKTRLTYESWSRLPGGKTPPSPQVNVRGRSGLEQAKAAYLRRTTVTGPAMSVITNTPQGTSVPPRITGDGLAGPTTRPGYQKVSREWFYHNGPEHTADDMITHHGKDPTSKISRAGALSPVPIRRIRSVDRSHKLSSISPRQVRDRDRSRRGSPRPSKLVQAPVDEEVRRRQSVWSDGRVTRDNPRRPGTLVSCFPTVAPEDRPTKRDVSFLLRELDGVLTEFSRAPRTSRSGTGRDGVDLMFSQASGKQLENLKKTLAMNREEDTRRSLGERTESPPWQPAGQRVGTSAGERRGLRVSHVSYRGRGHGVDGR
jgi:hypothetical protein